MRPSQGRDRGFESRWGHERLTAASDAKEGCGMPSTGRLFIPSVALALSIVVSCTGGPRIPGSRAPTLSPTVGMPSPRGAGNVAYASTFRRIEDPSLRGTSTRFFVFDAVAGPRRREWTAGGYLFDADGKR